jgi:hypothetical protein
MIRRSVMRSDWDQTVVKWSLIAAAVALMMGWMAESQIERHASEGSLPAVEQTVEVVAPVLMRAG